jgi:uncharacterized protein DUF4446
VPDDLTTAAGIAALAAGGVALLAFLLVLVLWMKLRRVRTAQTTVLGTSGERDLVTHAENLEIGFAQLQSLVEETFRRVEQRLEGDEARIQRSISKTAVVRYDAYGEMSGRQSSSMARMYVKGVRDGRGELELSPEEDEAIRTALGEAVVAETHR